MQMVSFRGKSKISVVVVEGSITETYHLAITTTMILVRVNGPFF